MIDEHLNWKEQIRQVQTGMSRITGVMYRASHVLAGNCKLTYTIPFTILTYDGLLLQHLGKCMCHLSTLFHNLHCFIVLQKRQLD